MAWQSAEVVEELTGTCLRAEAGHVGSIDLVAGVADAFVELFDGDPATDGTLIETLETAANLSSLRDYGDGIGLPKGIYIQMAGDGAVAYVRFK